MRFLIPLLFFSAFADCVRSEDPAEIWMEGYLYLQKALSAEEVGDTKGSVHLLVRSLDCYRILALQFADFEENLRKERVDLISDKLESVGGNSQMTFLPASGFGAPALESTALIGLRDSESLVNLLAPAIPHNWSLRSNETGTSVIVPLIETEEARRFSALVRRIDSYPAFQLTANEDVP